MSNNDEQKKPAAAPKKKKPAGSPTSKRPAKPAKADNPPKKKKKKTEAVLHHSPEGHTGGKQETADPVSDTHLDVYKRQPWTRIRILTSSGMI